MTHDSGVNQAGSARMSGEGLTVEPEIRAAFARQVEWALAKRSVSGALVYFVMSVVVGLTTPYYKDHPAVLLGAGCAVLLLGATRALTARRLMTRPAGAAPATKALFLGSVYACFAAWGIFCGWTLLLYPGQWTAMFVLLTTASLAGGASSSLAPEIRLATRCLVLLFAPTIAASAFLGDARHLSVTAGGLIYLGFLIAQARDNWRAFWTASVAAERERIRGSEERRRAEEERASLVAAIEQLAEQILITDVKGNIRYCNPAFEVATGYSREEVVGRNPRFLKSGKHDEEFYHDIWKTILGGRVWTGRLTNRRKDGTLYEEDGTISPIYDGSNRLTGFVSAGHDVTDRLRMEAVLRQAQKMESIGRLAGAIAHDFNNLLTVISGYSVLLQDDLKDERHAKYAGEISRAAERAATLTKQLLTFSRKQILMPKPVDLNTLTAGMREAIRELVGEGIEVITVPGPELGLVLVDPDQMHQIIMNLAANARDAMPRGGRLTIATENVDEDGSGPGAAKPLAGPAVLLSLSDTGLGIDEDVRPHVFEPFFTTKGPGRGTGLGLATVYGIVQQSDGAIDFESEVGSGTTFRIYLPRVDAPGLPEETESAGPELVSSEATVLVVEDEDEVRRLMTGVLAAEGFHVLEAPNGRAALLKSQQFTGRIDLLLTDVVMPDMSGREVAAALAPSRPDMRVLYTSGYSDEIIAHRGVLDAGVAYLPKPFTPSGLAAKVRQVLGTGRGEPPSYFQAGA